MTDKVVVLVTAASLKEARKIARGLVQSRLAACVNVVPSVESIYRWQGKIENSRERLLMIKTAREIFAEVAGAIRKLHSYTNPEIICLPIVDGSHEYLEWLTQSVKVKASAEVER